MKAQALKLKPVQLSAACVAWDIGGCQGLGLWLAQAKLGRDYYAELVTLVRAELNDTIDYSQEDGDVGTRTNHP